MLAKANVDVSEEGREGMSEAGEELECSMTNLQEATCSGDKNRVKYAMCRQTGELHWRTPGDATCCTKFQNARVSCATLHLHVEMRVQLVARNVEMRMFHVQLCTCTWECACFACNMQPGRTAQLSRKERTDTNCNVMSCGRF